MNDLPTQEFILKPGEVYYLQRKAKRAKIPFHVVQQSQTLWDISAVYGIRLKSLLHYNRIKPNQRVQTGRIIWMQRRRPVRTPIEYQLPPLLKDENPNAPALIAGDTTSLMSAATPTPAEALVLPVSKPISIPPASPAKISRPDSSVAVPVVASGPKSASSTTPGRITKVHVVKPGQTYFSIAKLYGTTIEQLCVWNRVTVNDPLLVGQELLIDTLGPVAPARQLPAATQGQSAKPGSIVALGKRLQYYSVKAGETVYRIALNHAVSVPELMRWNNLKNFTIEVGQRLIIWQPVN